MGLRATLRALVAHRRLPVVTRFEDRWAWIHDSIVPRYLASEADRARMVARLEHILGVARSFGGAHTCGTV